MECQRYGPSRKNFQFCPLFIWASNLCRTVHCWATRKQHSKKLEWDYEACQNGSVKIAQKMTKNLS